MYLKMTPKTSATWSRTNTLFRTFLIIALAFVHVTNGTVFCNPDDPSTCQFNGKCVSVLGLKKDLRQFGVSNDAFYCRCPEVHCSSAEDIAPVCGSDGVTYMNEVCLSVEECGNQAPITPVCRGFCGTEECIPIDQNSLYERCPPELAYFCSENSRCVKFPGQRDNIFCKCFNGYEGTRCDLKIAGVLEEMECDGEFSNYKWAFFFCIGLLAVILILQIVYCVFRIRSSDTQNDFAECCKTQREKEKSEEEKVEEQIQEEVDQVNQVNKDNEI